MLRFFLAFTLAFASFSAARAQGTDASALFAAGERAFAAGQYREALQSFIAARTAGSSGPSVDFNIGVSEYRLGAFRAAEASFARVAARSPALRELAEYNRGLALRAAGELPAARIAFERARVSSDDKIAALANAQLAELGVPPAPRAPSWRSYFSGGIGYDENVALIDELLLPSGQSSSSPLVEALGLVTRDFGSVPLRLDATGYAVTYTDAGEFDQSAMRVALVTERDLGGWRLTVGPTLARTTLDGDGFERLVGADVRLRRTIGANLWFETRFIYDAADAADVRFAYVEGSRRQIRLAVQLTGAARLRVGFDLEHNDRADPGVSPSRQRLSVSYERALSDTWAGEARVVRRTSRYDDATIRREERLLEVSFAARRELRAGWTFGTEYRWSDNDASVDAYSYDSQRVTMSMSRSF